MFINLIYNLQFREYGTIKILRLTAAVPVSNSSYIILARFEVPQNLNLLHLSSSTGLCKSIHMTITVSQSEFRYQSGDANKTVHPELRVTQLNIQQPTPLRAILYQLHISKYKILNPADKQQKYQKP
jgi:hypothetical protein